MEDFLEAEQMTCLTVGNLHIRGMGFEGQTLEESLSDDLGGPICGSKLPQWDLFYLSGKR